MEDLIMTVSVLILLFVGFGLSQRHGSRSPGCPGCSGCADKSECTKNAGAVQKEGQGRSD